MSAVTISFSLWFQRNFTGNNTSIPFFLHPFTLQWECCPHPSIGHSSALWNKKKERLYLVSRCVWHVLSLLLLLLLLRYMGLEMWRILSLCCHCCCCYWGCGSGGGHVEVSWNYNKKIKKRKPIKKNKIKIYQPVTRDSRRRWVLSPHLSSQRWWPFTVVILVAVPYT